MANNQYNKLFRYCWYGSVVCYILSFVPPVYSLRPDDIQFGQGLFMLVWGWAPAGLFQFLAWFANPVYFILRVGVRTKTNSQGQFTSTRAMRFIASVIVVLGLFFFLDGKLINDEGGCPKKILTFHIGYWMWEASMVLLALALMAKSEEESVAHRVVEVYLRLTGKIPVIVKVLIAIALGILLEWNAMSSLRQKDNEEKGPLFSMYFTGNYNCYEKIRVQFRGNNKVIATISSTDSVSYTSKEIVGRYTYDAPYVFVNWEEWFLMKYMEYDSIGHRMIMYCNENTSCLYQYSRQEENITNHPFYYSERVIYPDNDYYIVDRDMRINAYGTNARELRLPEGYRLSYSQIFDHMMRKFNIENGRLTIFDECEDKVLKYEDDSLLIVFDRMNIVTTSSNEPLRIEDYSAVPMVVFDKRKKR